MINHQYYHHNTTLLRRVSRIVRIILMVDHNGDTDDEATERK